ncbi:intradiol ring-cleavage dioxygenase [Trinickia sp. YCB016]
MTFDRHFSRRRFLTTSLALGTALQFPLRSEAAQTQDTGLCRLTAEQEVGPYYLEDNLLRSDITEGKAGVPLTLDIAIIDKRHCAPLANAIVDIWHCDALGVYSGFTKLGGNQPAPAPAPTVPPGPPPAGWGDASHGFAHDGPPPGPPPQSMPTDKLTFLRGIQRTDNRGNVTFRTIVPGLYAGRTNHIHFKVRVQDTSLAGEHVSHVGQVFFSEELMVRLMRADPYRRNTVARTTQSEDPVFAHQHGDAAIARTSALHGEAYEQGMRAQVIAVVDPDATPQPVDALHPSWK